MLVEATGSAPLLACAALRALDRELVPELRVLHAVGVDEFSCRLVLASRQHSLRGLLPSMPWHQKRVRRRLRRITAKHQLLCVRKHALFHFVPELQPSDDLVLDPEGELELVRAALLHGEGRATHRSCWLKRKHNVFSRFILKKHPKLRANDLAWVVRVAEIPLCCCSKQALFVLAKAFVLPVYIKKTGRFVMNASSSRPPTLREELANVC